MNIFLQILNSARMGQQAAKGGLGYLKVEQWLPNNARLTTLTPEIVDTNVSTFTRYFMKVRF